MKVVIAIVASVFTLSAAQAQMGSASSNAADSAQSSAAGTSARDASEDRKVEAHIRQLRRDLQITDAEEPQWDSVAKTMRENAEEVDRAIDKREASVKNANALDNLNAYADVVQAHAVAVKRLADTFAPLYAEMSDSQKKRADEVFTHRHHEKTVAKS
jgi:hypothetical protein